MEMRPLGSSGLQVSAVSFGVMTFGGVGRFSAVGSTQLDEATALVDQCLEAGVNLFDTADVYSIGASEEILGQAIGKRREDVLIATKLHARMGPGPNDLGQSRQHIVRACEDSLRRLGTDWIDIYQMHGFDGLTPLEESLSALDDLVRSGKVRYLGCSNYSGWQLMKSQAVAERRGYERHVALQAYYSLVGRELEHELVPLSVDQGLGILVWSPLAAGFLTGKFRRGEASPEGTRRAANGDVGTFDEEQGFDIVEALEEVAKAHDASVAQTALAWLLTRPAVSSVIVGARRAEQLADNLKAAELQLSPDEVTRLNEVSATPLPYPYWHQQQFNAERLPPAMRPWA